MNDLRKQVILPVLSLFTSFGTLICCALPALLVTLGMGAALAGAVSSMPWLSVLTDNKDIVFIVAGVMIVIAGIMQWRGRNAPCPADPELAAACKRLRLVSWIIYGVSLLLYATGMFFAYFAADLLL